MKKCNLITLIILFTIALQLKAQEKNFIDMPYVEVTGSADSMVTPNEIYIKISLSERDSRDRTSLEEQERKMVDVLKKNGINTEKDLTTSDIASNFKTYIFSKNILKSKEYILKINTADKMSKVVADLETSGISNTSIDHVDHSNLENIKMLIRSKASENARKKANVLVRPHDRAAGALLYISDMEKNISDQLSDRFYGVQIRGVGSPGAGSEVRPRIEFEKIKVSANVNAKFALKNL